MKKVPVTFDRIIYDPIKGRFMWDMLSSLSITSFISFLFIFIANTSISLLAPITYTFIFLLSNIILGLYGNNKAAPLKYKIAILIISNIVALSSLSIITLNYFIYSLFALTVTISTVLPRFFLNFNIERTAFNKLGYTKKENPILIVGGGGYIGSVLVEELLRKGEKVRVFDKFIYGKEVFKGIRNAKNLELIEGDISDVYSLTLAVKDSKAIVHLAGIVGDPAAQIDENLTRHVNIASTRLLKETAKAFGIERFIFASSCSVYGFSNKIQNENSRPKPVSLYAKTKVDSEKELLSDTADNFHPTILRFATVFGHSRKPRFDLVTNIFVAEAFYKNQITVYNGSQWRPLIHVKDITNAIIIALNAPISTVSRQIYNVGDDDMNITIEDLAITVKKVMKNEKIKIKILKKQKDKRNYRVSFSKIENQLNFNSSISLEKGIGEMYRNIKNKKYKKSYLDSYYVNFEKTKELRREFRSKKYKASHFTAIS